MLRWIAAMPNLGRLMGLLTLGRPTIDAPVFRNLLSGLVAVVGLTIVSGMMMGTLLVAALYIILQVLIHYGMDPNAALFATGVITAIITGVLVLLTFQQMRRLMEVPKSLVRHEYPVTDRLGSIARSFMDGMSTSKATYKKKVS